MQMCDNLVGFSGKLESVFGAPLGPSCQLRGVNSRGTLTSSLRCTLCLVETAHIQLQAGLPGSLQKNLF